ncbi:hypothetical protein ACP4OV_024890 [Aristida adscensionis]
MEKTGDGSADEAPVLDRWARSVLIAQITLSSAIVVSLVALLIVLTYASAGREATEISVELTGVEGLNATTVRSHGGTVSPAFGLKVRSKTPRLLQTWCYSDGGEVVVSYSGVALAWGHVPGFCVRRSPPVEFTVRPWGREVGLSEDRRQRLADDWDAGTTQVSVRMKLFFDDSKDHWSENLVSSS